MVEDNKPVEKTYMYKVSIGQTAKREWYIKEITVREDAIRDMDIALKMAIEKVKAHMETI